MINSMNTISSMDDGITCKRCSMKESSLYLPSMLCIARLICSSFLASCNASCIFDSSWSLFMFGLVGVSYLDLGLGLAGIGPVVCRRCWSKAFSPKAAGPDPVLSGCTKKMLLWQHILHQDSPKILIQMNLFLNY